jgi:glucosamine-6-phosphate deaminase
LREALRACEQATWFTQAELWLYRGVSAEWRLDEIDLAVPLSPQEVRRRRRAVLRHGTQRDQAVFLGEDRREFWQVTEDRCRQLAESYNALGLAEYEAIEAFKRYAPDEFLRSVQI